MKYAADFRAIARNALSGRWGVAVIAGLIASLLGGISFGGSNSGFDFSGSGSAQTGDPFQALARGNEDLLLAFLVLAAVILAISLVMALVFLFVGSVVALGYAKFNLDLLDRQSEPDLRTLFGYFRHWGTALVANLLQTIYVFLWSLLFIIPGIIASYSYAMTPYILAEHPELTASEAIESSKRMMEGNRFRLFCLQWSFFGWNLLCALTLGIGNLWLLPYQQAAIAAFYREVSGTEAVAVPTADGHS